MTIKQARRHFKTYAAMARACGVCSEAVTLWNSRQSLPPIRELQLHRASGGVLALSPAAKRLAATL